MKYYEDDLDKVNPDPLITHMKELCAEMVEIDKGREKYYFARNGTEEIDAIYVEQGLLQLRWLRRELDKIIKAKESNE